MLMRSLLGQFLVPVLATLLVVTTPIGTGQGIHASQLLHPIFAHLHVIHGRIVSDEQLAAARASAVADRVIADAQAGPALDTGNGADAPGVGIAVGPTLPLLVMRIVTGPDGRLPGSVSRVPEEFLDAPEDPPPNALA
jgi:hypothetical protein